jgi:glycosyltransferase involved in cell wall biosynthesis
VRIAFCANGESPHAQRWANGLAARGHEVAFIWAADQLESADLSAFSASISHHAHVTRAELGRPWMLPTVMRAARRLAARLRPDVAHGLDLYGPAWTAQMLGVRPLVLSALGSDVGRLRGHSGGTLRARAGEAYRRSRTRAAVAAADVVLADSEALAAVVRERVPGTGTRIIRFGVEPEPLHPSTAAARASWRARLGIADHAFVLLSSRLVHPLYNIDTIVTALPEIRRRVPGSVLVLKDLPQLSDPEYRRRCFELVRELGLQDAVRSVDELPRGELLELFAAADVYVSVPTTDGTAVSLFEAMAAGVPIVASDADGLDPEIVRNDETAIVVPRRNPDALAAAVVVLALDGERRRRIVEGGRETVRLHGDFDRELDRAVLIYEELLARAAVPSVG